MVFQTHPISVFKLIYHYFWWLNKIIVQLKITYYYSNELANYNMLSRKAVIYGTSFIPLFFDYCPFILKVYSPLAVVKVTSRIFCGSQRINTPATVP